MISNPKNGWCDFKLGNFDGTPSYIADVPVGLLDAFINLHEYGCGVAWLDEEGTEFTLVLNPYSMFIIEENKEPILHNFSDIDVSELEKELINDIESDIDNWQWFIPSDDTEEIAQYRREIILKIEKLKEYVR